MRSLCVFYGARETAEETRPIGDHSLFSGQGRAIVLVFFYLLNRDLVVLFMSNRYCNKVDVGYYHWSVSSIILLLLTCCYVLLLIIVLPPCAHTLDVIFCLFGTFISN